jgi:hypothetical protein
MVPTLLLLNQHNQRNQHAKPYSRPHTNRPFPSRYPTRTTNPHAADDLEDLLRGLTGGRARGTAPFPKSQQQSQRSAGLYSARPSTAAAASSSTPPGRQDAGTLLKHPLREGRARLWGGHDKRSSGGVHNLNSGSGGGKNANANGSATRPSAAAAAAGHWNATSAGRHEASRRGQRAASALPSHANAAAVAAATAPPASPRLRSGENASPAMIAHMHAQRAHHQRWQQSGGGRDGGAGRGGEVERGRSRQRQRPLTSPQPPALVTDAASARRRLMSAGAGPASRGGGGGAGVRYGQTGSGRAETRGGSTPRRRPATAAPVGRGGSAEHNERETVVGGGFFFFAAAAVSPMPTPAQPRHTYAPLHANHAKHHRPSTANAAAGLTRPGTAHHLRGRPQTSRLQGGGVGWRVHDGQTVRGRDGGGYDTTAATTPSKGAAAATASSTPPPATKERWGYVTRPIEEQQHDVAVAELPSPAEVWTLRDDVNEKGGRESPDDDAFPSPRRQVSSDSLPTGAAYPEEHYPQEDARGGGGAHSSDFAAAAAGADRVAAGMRWPPLGDADDGYLHGRRPGTTPPGGAPGGRSPRLGPKPRGVGRCKLNSVDP